MALTKSERRLRIRNRIRKIVSGTAKNPRLSVYRSNKEIYAQLIDDVAGVTLVSASSKASQKGIENCAFDRSGYLYHGRVQQLANGAREGGLKF